MVSPLVVIASTPGRETPHTYQNIYLADTTLAENIAFGVPAEDIDMERVQRATPSSDCGFY